MPAKSCHWKVKPEAEHLWEENNYHLIALACVDAVFLKSDVK